MFDDRVMGKFNAPLILVPNLKMTFCLDWMEYQFIFCNMLCSSPTGPNS